MRTITATPTMLRAGQTYSDKSIGVDRKNNTLRGFVVAQTGHFKTPGRGQFTDESLRRIVELGNADPRGIRSRFQHPGVSDDGLGSFLGRVSNFRLDAGKVRGDLRFNSTALQIPPKKGRPLGEYVMDLAESDPGALGSSVVVETEKIPTPDGPDVWVPMSLRAVDFVDEGDATHGPLFGLSAETMSEEKLLAYFLKLNIFPNASREVVASRIDGFFDRFLSSQFGDKQSSKPTSPPRDPVLDLRAEYEQHRKIHEVLGISFEKFASRRRKELAEQPAREMLTTSHRSDSELRAEYETHRKIHEVLGITFEKFAARRRKEIAAAQ